MSAPSRTLVAWCSLLALLLAACGDASEVRWRDLRLQLPEGWTVFEEEDTRLSLASAPLGAETDTDGLPDEVAAMFFTHEPSASPDDWRRLVRDRDGATLEVDRRIDVGGVPATQLIWSSDFEGQETREMVVVIPPRQVVLLAQPVPLPGDRGVREVFDANLDTFEAVLGSATWGAPIDRDGGGGTGG